MTIKKILSPFLAILAAIFSAMPVHAHCPLCTAATGAAVAATRFYGMDDMIVGLFIGGFVISTALWFNNILLKRNKGKNFLPYQPFIMVLASLLLTFWTFKAAKLIGTAAIMQQIFGVDKLLAGTTAGTILSLASFEFSKFLKRKNKGNVLFPFQTIVLTLLALAIAGLLVWLLVKQS